jgi:hypothetical protein
MGKSRAILIPRIWEKEAYDLPDTAKRFPDVAHTPLNSRLTKALRRTSSSGKMKLPDKPGFWC